MAEEEQDWWKGPRGEWYVVMQVFLMMLVVFGPPALPGMAAWDRDIASIAYAAGIVLIASGLGFIAAGLWVQRAQITPLPFPKEEAVLIVTGPYALVRHPVYTGAIFMSFGWGFMIQGWMTLLYAIMLFLFFDVKSRREEQWLSEKFPAYGAYQGRVRRLIPFLY